MCVGGKLCKFNIYWETWPNMRDKLIYHVIINIRKMVWFIHTSTLELICVALKCRSNGNYSLYNYCYIQVCFVMKCQQTKEFLKIDLICGFVEWSDYVHIQNWFCEYHGEVITNHSDFSLYPPNIPLIIVFCKINTHLHGRS